MSEEMECEWLTQELIVTQISLVPEFTQDYGNIRQRTSEYEIKASGILGTEMTFRSRQLPTHIGGRLKMYINRLED